MQNGIIGDSYGTELPVSQVEKQDLTDEKKMARFSKSVEFQRLRDYLEERIGFYQSHLPGGTDFIAATTYKEYEQLGRDAVVANVIIGEFKAVIQAYENAKEAVDAER